MSLVCEISGEPLLGNSGNEIVVTPSGHICIKRLLLTKLVETGGMDPFETTSELPLSEDQLVALQTGSSSVAPPRPQATSLPSMLGLIQKEYDALILELFDTRKALEETRRELSQALYQNDAAIRVVARVAQERDTIKQQLEQWNASAKAAGGETGDSSAKPAPSATGEEEPSAKRRRILEPTAEVLKNDLPEEDVKAMSDLWAELNKIRKPRLKAAALEAPSPKTLADCAFLETKAWHKSTNRGIPCISSSRTGDSSHLTATAGKDKQLVVYNEVDKVVQNTFALGFVATCVGIGNSLVVAGNAKGTIAAYSVGSDASGKGSNIDVGASVVDVCIHPTGQHVCAATKDGTVVVACWIAEEERLQHIATFEAKEGKEGYASAALHPDGLIYVAGTKTGKMHVWDFKNKVLAATLPEGDKGGATTAIAISNNGYHIAAGHESGTVRFWDLRKQKVVATLDKQLESPIRTVAFDRAGKYAAFGGKGGVKITKIKEWGTTGSLDTKHPVTGIVWSNSKSSDSVLEVSCDGERAVQLFGAPPS